ncbi:hypothetical protein J1N35_018887, partial [Gossypium stocksii]
LVFGTIPRLVTSRKLVPAPRVHRAFFYKLGSAHRANHQLKSINGRMEHGSEWDA